MCYTWPTLANKRFIYYYLFIIITIQLPSNKGAGTILEIFLLALGGEVEFVRFGGGGL